MKSGIRIAVAGLASLAWVAYAGHETAQAATPTFTTISRQSAADPGFSKFGSSYYVYATGGGDGILPIFRGIVANPGFAKVGNTYKSPQAGLNNLWAPHVVARDGRYFMFFTAAKGSAPALRVLGGGVLADRPFLRTARGDLRERGRMGGNRARPPPRPRAGGVTWCGSVAITTRAFRTARSKSGPAS